jgi:hypothetical protein
MTVKASLLSRFMNGKKIEINSACVMIFIYICVKEYLLTHNKKEKV